MIQWYGFELLVMCIGKFGDIPRMPAFPANKGEEIFGGKVLHSMDYSKLDKEAATELLQGKKVAIIGYRKSAIDLAVECAEANQGIQKINEPSFFFFNSINLAKKILIYTFIDRNTACNISI